MNVPSRRARYEVVYLTDDGWKRWSGHRKREKADEALVLLRSFYGRSPLLDHRSKIVDRLVIDILDSNTERES